ncbi:hypothetical protein FSP39_023834 [Pinctada imbricata]|uniref:Mab-21-like HhH/H2TH-like domain-containing protein n=1 Tax=Pinctada imbricata TaxID=66713 RepID=A0AA89C4E8_PINIB|nr:hypothetical protein FSP39_023834 [Pinctada imbricata]
MMSWHNNTHFYKVLIDVYLQQCVEEMKSKTNESLNKQISWFPMSLLNTTGLLELIKGWVHEDKHIIEDDRCQEDSEFHYLYIDLSSDLNDIPCSSRVYIDLAFCFVYVISAFVKRFSERRRLEPMHTFEEKRSLTVDSEPVITSKSNTSMHTALLPSKIANTIILHSFSRRNIGTTPSLSCDIHSFVRHTADMLAVQMDKFLVDRHVRASTPLQNVVSSPRISRRQMLRTTGRLNNAQNSEMEEADDDPMERVAWQEFHQKIVYGGRFVFNSLNYDDIIDKSSGPSKTLLDFYRNHCCLDFSKATVANLIVNYSLLMLEKSLMIVDQISGVRFLDFVPTGSCSLGTKCMTPNQYDVLFLLQCTDLQITHVLDRINLSDTPHGKLFLCSEQKSSHRLLKKKGEHTCLSCLEFSAVARELTDMALQKLNSEARSVIDRLPFRLQRTTSSGIVLTIDTRSVFGFGQSEISIRLIPCIPLHLPGCALSAMLYAVPSWSHHDIKRKPPSVRDRYTNFLSDNITYSSDLCWSVSYGNLESSYLQFLDWKFTVDGEQSCHVVCLQILKGLLASVSRKTLLSKGEIPSYILQSVIFFILVDSSTKQWSFQSLHARFSDAIHFLQRALQNKRLPNFFYSNPYVIKQLPYLNCNQFLTRGRQENLISELTPELTDKMLDFIECRLQETGLGQCVMDEYSEDMWEYEYFLQV